MRTHRLAEKCLNFRRFEKLQNLYRGRDQIIRNYKSIEIHDVLNINPSSTGKLDTPVVDIMLTWLLALGTIRYDKFELLTGKFSTTGVRFYKPLSWVYVVEMSLEIYHSLL